MDLFSDTDFIDVIFLALAFVWVLFSSLAILRYKEGGRSLYKLHPDYLYRKADPSKTKE